MHTKHRGHESAGLALLPEDRESAAYRSSRGVERLATFSDAVVAIAITLIVLPLIEAASAPRATAEELFAVVGYRFADAALSFVVIGALWLEHHEAFERASVDSRRLVSLNLFWLAAVVFLPVPTAVLLVPEALDAGESVVVTLYTATSAVAGFAKRVMKWEIRRHCSESPVAVSRARLVAQWAKNPILLSAAAVLASSGLGVRALWLLLLTVPLSRSRCYCSGAEGCASRAPAWPRRPGRCLTASRPMSPPTRNDPDDDRARRSRSATQCRCVGRSSTSARASCTRRSAWSCAAAESCAPTASASRRWRSTADGVAAVKTGMVPR